MALHVANLFKLNNLVQEVDFQTLSLAKLKEHYIRVKSLQSNTKLLNSLPDKGEKYLSRLNKIEDIIRKRCSDLEASQTTQPKEKIEITDLTELLNKFQKVEIECASPIKEEKISLKENVKKEKSEAEKNYFSKPLSDDPKLHVVKERVLKSMENQVKFPKAKEIALGECFNLLKEHEKRVQEFQIQQAANKLLEGKGSAVYDYSSIRSERQVYRERLSSESSGDSDDDDNFNGYYDDDDGDEQEGSRIDRLHVNEANKMKFKMNDDS